MHYQERRGVSSFLLIQGLKIQVDLLIPHFIWVCTELYICCAWVLIIHFKIGHFVCSMLIELDGNCLFAQTRVWIFLIPI